MPLTLTSAVVQPSIGGYRITGINIDVEAANAGITVEISYIQTDASLNPLPGGVAGVVLGPAAVSTFLTTAGNLKARAYAALQSQLGLAGTVT